MGLKTKQSKDSEIDEIFIPPTYNDDDVFDLDVYLEMQKQEKMKAKEIRDKEKLLKKKKLLEKRKHSNTLNQTLTSINSGTESYYCYDEISTKNNYNDIDSVVFNTKKRERRKNIILDSKVAKILDKNSISCSFYATESERSNASSEFNFTRLRGAFNQGYIAGRLNGRPIWKKVIQNKKTKENNEDCFDPNIFFEEKDKVITIEEDDKENENQLKKLETKVDLRGELDEGLSIYTHTEDRVKIYNIRKKRRLINDYYLNQLSSKIPE